MKPNEQVCGCGGKGVPAGESSVRGGFGTTGENRPLFQLAHLIAMLERQGAAKLAPDGHVKQSGPKNGNT